ncbi:hypothetical protein N665_0562s0004 [Sinapis alba]|nr:hypothetical protein N665_0562s0004 [Sinapis alba]
MYTKKFLSILCLVLLAFSLGFVSAQICGESLFFRPTSAYDRNRLLVLSTLASNVSSREGYYNASVGEGPSRIYALGLCLPGTDPKVCSDCITPASASLLQNCPNQTDSWFWRSEDETICFVRYSNRSFFNQNGLQPKEEYIYPLDVTGDVAEYKRTWGDFMERMISSASSSSPGSLAGRHYEANTTPLSGFRRIYALMQCIPGISSADCDACLQENVGYFQSCCGGKQGGSIRRPVCFFRFDLYPFRNAFHNIASSPPPQSSQDRQELQPTTSPPPPPPSVGKKISTRVIMAIIVSTAWRLWRKGAALEIVDRTIGESYQKEEVRRCIHIALLCVQKDPGDRPMMSKIILLLTSSTITLQLPRVPGFYFRSSLPQHLEAEGSDSFGKLIPCSVNDASITELDPR